jgi:TRAP-type C4-dicarboxylate transport system substrate-binding protein
VAAEEFAERVSERTNELVRITITSISELGRIDLESDPWQEDGTFRLMEIHSDHLGPLVDMDNLWGSYGDYETQLRVTEAIREDVERSIEEKTGGVVLAYLFYPSNYYFSNRPLRTAADMGGLRTRTFLPSGKKLFDQQSHTNVSRDLLDGMGAISVSKSYTQVYEELRKNNLDAAVSCSARGSNIAWYEVADYLVGPIVALSHSWIIVSRERWASLPQEIQVVIREEAKLLEETTRRNALTVWDQQGVEDNIAGGMEYIELTPELNALARQAALTNVLPKWVERAGGPQSEAALIYNAKVAPIVKMEITGEGEARDLE